MVRVVRCATLHGDEGFVRELDCPVALMLGGKIVRKGSFDALQADPLVKEAYLGQA